MFGFFRIIVGCLEALEKEMFFDVKLHLLLESGSELLSSVVGKVS